jgi:hypothetical protein
VTNSTVAAGMIVGSSVKAAAQKPLHTTGTQIGIEERRERLGQTGLVVTVLAPSRDEARDRAFVLERELFDLGCVATVIDAAAHLAEPLAAASACARAGLVAIAIGHSDRPAIEIDGESIADAWAETIHARTR